MRCGKYAIKLMTVALSGGIGAAVGTKLAQRQTNLTKLAGCLRWTAWSQMAFDAYLLESRTAEALLLSECARA
jgi:hypothetical protein